MATDPLYISTPVAPTPQFKDRKPWLIVFGVVQTLIGLLWVIFSLLMAVTLPATLAKNNNPQLTPGVMAAVIGMYSILAVVFITMGVGSILAKNWARIGSIILSTLWLVIGMMVTLFTAILMPGMMKQMQSQTPNAGAVNFGAVIGVLLVFYCIFLVALPAVFILFYTRNSVKATCLANRPKSDHDANKLPGPVIALIVFSVLGCFSYLFTMVALPHVVLFGFMVHGLAARSIFAVCLGIEIWMAYQIYNVRRIGWVTTVVFRVVWLVSGLVSLIFWHDPIALSKAMGMGVDTGSTNIYAQFPMFYPLMMVGTYAVLIAYLAFIFWTGKFFPKEENVTPAPPMPQSMPV